MPSSPADFVAATPLFQGLSAGARAELAAKLTSHRFAAGDVLVEEGLPCEGMYLLTSGRVRITRRSRDGRETTVAWESPPSTSGELPLFDGGPYPATVRAVEEVTALFLAKEDFRAACYQRPELALTVLASVGRRLRRLIESIDFGAVTRRLARYLLEQSQLSGQDVIQLPGFDPELTTRLCAEGGAITQSLERLIEGGVIRNDGGRITILDRTRLEDEASVPD